MVSFLYKRMIRELRKIKYRAVGSAVLIVISVSIFIAISGMIPTAVGAMDEKVKSLHLHDLLIHVREGNESQISELTATPHIVGVEARIAISSRINIKNQNFEGNITALLYGIDSSNVPKVDTLELFTPDSSYFGGNASESVLVERNFAANKGIRVGDEIYMNTVIGLAKLKVAGIVMTPEYLVLPTNPQAIMPLPGSMAVAYVPIDWLRTNFGFSAGYVNEFAFLFNNTANRKQLEDIVTSKLSKNVIMYAIPWEKNEFATLTEHIANNPVGAFSAIFLVIAFFIVYTSFARVVQEQRREIGVLRALGYSRGAVLLSYLFMALLIGVIASVAGLVIGIPLSLIIGDFYSEMLIGASANSFAILPNTLLTSFLFGPMTTSIACVMAVRGTVSMDPQDAIKGTPHTFLKSWRKGKKTVGSFRTRRTFNASYVVRYTMKNMSRHRIRTIFTVVAVSGTIILGSYAFLMLASFNNSIEYGLGKYEKWDVLVEFAYPLDEVASSQVISSNITERAYISRAMVEWQKNGNNSAVLAVGLEGNQMLHNFQIDEGVKAAYVAEAMINRKVAEDADIQVGDVIQLECVNGTSTVNITAFVEDFVGGLYVDIRSLEGLTGQKVYNGMYVKTVAGEVEGVKETLLVSPYVTGVITLTETAAGFREYMSSYGSLLYVLTLLGIVVIAPTLANIVFLEVLERYPEYGQLRAIGYSRRSIAKIVVIELSLMVATAIIIGVPLAYSMMLYFESTLKVMLPAYTTILFPADWISYFGVSLLVYFIALLAAVPSIRRVNKMNIAETIGERFG